MHLMLQSSASNGPPKTNDSSYTMDADSSPYSLPVLPLTFFKSLKVGPKKSQDVPSSLKSLKFLPFPSKTGDDLFLLITSSLRHFFPPKHTGDDLFFVLLLISS